MLTSNLNATAIQQALEIGLRSNRSETQNLGREIKIHEQLGSTNDETTARAQSGAEEGLVVAVETQTAGRGRKGNSWLAPGGKNLTFSVLLRPSFPSTSWPRLAHVAGLAVARGVEPWLNGQKAQLKWPNDVYADEKKLAGILVETKMISQSQAFVILGIGLNVNSLPDDFSLDLRQSVTSVKALNGGAEIDRSQVLGSILAELNWAYELVANDFARLLVEIEQRSFLSGKQIRFVQNGHWQTAQMVGMGENGEMLVRSGDGTTESVLSADEVRLV